MDGVELGCCDTVGLGVGRLDVDGEMDGILTFVGFMDIDTAVAVEGCSDSSDGVSTAAAVGAAEILAATDGEIVEFFVELSSSTPIITELESSSPSAAPSPVSSNSTHGITIAEMMSSNSKSSKRIFCLSRV